MVESDKIDESKNSLDILSSLMEYGRRITDTIWDRLKLSKLSIDNPPSTVRVVTRLKQNSVLLKTLMRDEIPTRRFIRGRMPGILSLCSSSVILSWAPCVLVVADGVKIFGSGLSR